MLMGWALKYSGVRVQVFYRVHILGFLGFVIFGWMHHTSMWAFCMPGVHHHACTLVV
jgi:hypothetical protein